jgi:hypothetical protein
VSALAVPQTTLLATDRLAVRIYVTHSGRTITLHTENSHLCQVITTFSTGLTALNGLTTQVQSFATGTSGTDFGISSATSTHTFNLPTASAANRGALSSTDWTTFNGKFTLPSLTSGSVLFSNGTTIAQDNANLFWDDTNNRLGIGTATPGASLDILSTSGNVLRLGRSGYDIYTFRSSIGSGLELFNTTDLRSEMFFNGNGNIGIGTTTDAGFRLDVNGTARVQGTSIFTADATINGHTVGRGGGDVSTNVVVGSAISNNTGLNGTFLGNLAGGNNTSGSRNTYIGYTSGFNQTTGNNNVFAGERAGRYIADGATSNTIANDSIFIGQNTKPLANNQTNQIVIGYNAIGAGSNTATLGNTSIIDTILRGRINLQQYATGSRPTYVKGALIYDSTLGKLVVGGATGWEVVTSI